MHKKLVIAFLTLVSAFSAGYAYYNNFSMRAASGSVTGRVNMAPSGISGSNIGWKKEDKIILGVEDDGGNHLGWQLVYNSSDQTWLCAATESIGSISIIDSSSDPFPTFFKDTRLKPIFDTFNAQLASLPYESSILVPRIINPSWGSDEWQKQDPNQTQMFLPAIDILRILGISETDPAFTTISWAETQWGTTRKLWSVIGDPGGVAEYSYNTRDIRPFAYWDLSNVVFAASDGFGSVDSSAGQKMKIRALNTGLGVQLNDIQNNNNESITKVVKNGTVYLDAFAQAGSNSKGVNTLSVIVFKDNNFVYYKPLEPARGSGKYEFDTSDLGVGSYKIGIVNEIYDAGSDLPSESSAITSVKSLNIVEPHKLAYTKQPQSGAILGDYEFSKNVNAGQTVGKITVNPTGATPLTYTLEGDGDNSYQNFEIDGLNADGKSSASTLNIKVKSGAPNLLNGGLQADDYKFCVSAKDNTGHPTTVSTGDGTKVCAGLTVEKTNATISFDNDDKGTTYITGDLTNTVSHTEHAKHTNMDIKNAKGEDVDIEYSYVSGTGGLISGLPYTSQNAGDQANITIAANKTGSVVIQAKAAESDNYNAATTTKTIKVQLGLSGNYVEDKVNIKAGSAEAKPPTSYTQANRIGYIDISGGIAPYTYTLPSGTGENGFFHIDSSGNVYVNQSVGSGGLTPGDYTIEVEVKDNSSPTKQTTTVTKTITIKAAALSGVGWEDPEHVGTALSSNTYEITYDPSGEPSNGGIFHTKLIETTSGTLADTVISYTLDPDPNNVLSISGTSTVNATVKKASDSTTLNNVKIKAHISGGIYGSTGVDTELIVNVKKYPQTIAFPDTTLLKLPVGGACESVSANITSTYHKAGETISYTSSNTNSNAPFTINAAGEVCPTSNASDAGSATLTGTLQGDDNYETATTQTGRVIQVYVPGNIEVTGSIENGGTSGVTYTPDATLKKALHTSASPNGGTAKQNTAVAQVSVTGSTFQLGTGSSNANADANYFTVTPTGYITLKQDITANDIKNHGTGNKYYIQVDVTDSESNTRTVDVVIVIENANADFYFIDPIGGTKLSLTDTYGTTNVPVYTATYAPSGTLDVKTNIDATYSEVTIAEAGGIPVDENVIDHNNLNHFTILNASDPDGDYGSGGDAYVKACMSAQNGYAAQCIYAKVEINKAEQNDFAFVNKPIWMVGKTPATIQPTYNGKLSQGNVLLSSNNNTIAEVLPPVSGQDQSFKTMGVVGTATLTATAPEDRNYNAKQATTTLETTERPPTTLSLFVPGMTYGDINIEAKITGGYKNGVPAYFYVDDSSILTVESTAVNSKTSPPITAIGSGQVIVKVCQTDQPFDPATDDCNAVGGDYGEQIIIVQKKPLNLTYQDETIYVGESFPPYQFINPPTNVFAFTDSITDFPIPNNTSAKKDGTAISDTQTKGIYDISGSYGSNELSGNAKHYNITLQSGKLTIKQDEAQANWYHLEDPDGTTVSASDWHNYIVDVVIDSANAIASAGTYDQISDTINFTNADKQRFTVTKEDDNLTDIYFRIDPTGSDPHKGAISDKLQDHVKIDMTKPNVLSITGYPVNTSGLSNLLNEITLGHYFKPGVQVEIKVEDPQPAGGNTVQISGIKEVSYQVYELDESGGMTSTSPLKTDTGTPGSNDILSFKLNDIGNYRVCATVTDNATNESTEKCSDLNIKKIDVDVDDDGKPDFNDPDGDGCPDLNIKWKDPNDANKWIVINGDRNNDGIPDLNIDSDGDGKADLNIDTDNDGKPDLNLVILKKTDWKPTKCVKKDITQGILEEYCTGTSAKATINVDLDGDDIPDINIDTTGDMKADINITKAGSEEPYLNLILPQHVWEPKKDYKKGAFIYDSIEKHDPIINIDTDGDGYPDVNIDLDGDMEPDINIDVDGDRIPDIDIDSDGDGIADINMDEDGDGVADKNVVKITEWKPDKNIDGDVPYDTMDISEPQAPDKPDKPTDPNNPDDPQEPNNPDIPNDPQNPNDANEPSQQDNPGTSVQGNYNPQDSMGGASTGDKTNLMMYMGISLLSLGILFLIIYKKKTES